MLKFIFKDRYNFFDLFIISFIAAMFSFDGFSVETFMVGLFLMFAGGFISTLAQVWIDRK